MLLEAKKLFEGYLSGAEASKDVLKTLGDLETFSVTKEELTKTKIGVVVNKLRKEAKDSEVQEAAVRVLSKWKDVMMPSSGSTEKSTDKTDKTGEKSVKSDNTTSNTTTTTNTHAKRQLDDKSQNDTNSPGEKKIKNDALSAYSTGDAVRDKCFEMFVAALMTDAKASEADEIIFSTAQSIERSLFAEFGSVCPAYKTKFRSKYLNLKDPKNPTLREALIEGMINSDRFIAMTSAEMASDERKSIDAKIAHQNLLNSQMAKDNSAETDQFKCGRCQQRRCKYYQMQTRSADEPMTTFVTCVNCGNRWRFC